MKPSEWNAKGEHERREILERLGSSVAPNPGEASRQPWNDLPDPVRERLQDPPAPMRKPAKKTASKKAPAKKATRKRA